MRPLNNVFPVLRILPITPQLKTVSQQRFISQMFLLRTILLDNRDRRLRALSMDSLQMEPPPLSVQLKSLIQIIKSAFLVKPQQICLTSRLWNARNVLKARIMCQKTLSAFVATTTVNLTGKSRNA